MSDSVQHSPAAHHEGAARQPVADSPMRHHCSAQHEPEAAQASPQVRIPLLRHLIGGDKVTGSGPVLPVHDPSQGTVVAEFASAGEAEVDAAVRCAAEAFSSWSSLAPAARARLLWRLADAVEDHAGELARLETLNTGKPLAAVESFEVPQAVEILRYNAGWATKLHGETRQVSLPGQWHTYTQRQPLGVAALIIPWNSPLVMAAAKLGPALAAGCTAVLKPAELTPLTAVRLGELATDAGFPPGVINIITGTGDTAGQSLAQHPGVDKISFTGSTSVGKHLQRSTADRLTRLSLELGGKSPAVIFDDADPEAAARGAAASIFNNAGQVCAAGSRLYVQEGIAEQVLDRIVGIAESLPVGGGFEPGVRMGPLISEAQQQRVLGYISGAEDDAELLTGGQAMPRAGYFVEPTVLQVSSRSLPVVQEEIFGPVLTVETFAADAQLDQVLDAMHDTRYGLSAYVWTSSLPRAHRLAAAARAGNVRVNSHIGMDPAMPFGGFGESGYGKDNGREGVESYTELKSVAISVA